VVTTKSAPAKPGADATLQQGETFLRQRAGDTILRRQRPHFVAELSKLQLPAPGPRTSDPSNDADLFIKQNLGMKIVIPIVLFRSWQSWQWLAPDEAFIRSQCRLEFRQVTPYIRHVTEAHMTALAAYREPDRLPESEPVRLAKLFGLGREAAASDLALADRVAHGLPVKAAYALEPVLRLVARDALFRVVSESTLRRARNAKSTLTREPSVRIYELGRVIDQAAKTFRGDEAAVARFLNRPNPVLHGRTPFDVAKSSSAGAEIVVKLLRKADAGVAV
jgi:putative toxin-antitoxin system antitoxin component (TIGR02293 family)